MSKVDEICAEILGNVSRSMMRKLEDAMKQPRVFWWRCGACGKEFRSETLACALHDAVEHDRESHGKGDVEMPRAAILVPEEPVE